MIDIVISIVAKVSEYLVAPIGRQLGYLFCYRSYTDDLNNKVQELGRVRDDLQRTVVDETKRAGYEIRPIVQEWLNRVDGITEEAEELMKDENKSCFKGWCPNLKSRYLLSRKADKKAQVIVQIQKEGNFPHGVSDRVPLRNLTFKNYEPFESRASILNKIMDAFGDDEIKMIGVWGMGGVGKTTLVKQVAEQAKQGKLFTTEVYIDVSWTRDLEKPQQGIAKIQQKIAEMLHFEFTGKDESTRAVELKHRLKKEKILIILDDIWKEIDLEEVGIPCKDDPTECKVVLTSRDLHVLSSGMDAKKLFRIEQLAEDEAWCLFNKTAGGSLEGNLELHPIAMMVVKKCEGLPIAITTIAKALKGGSLAVWKDALNELRASAATNIRGVSDNVYSCLEWSYKRLISVEVKSLFLLCGLLGDGDVSLHDLLKYGMGLDLFKNIDSLEQAGDRVVALVKILKASSLLLDASEDGSHFGFSSFTFAEEGNGFVRMHDVVRDVAKAIALKDHRFVVKEAHGLQGWQQRVLELGNCTRISLNCTDVRELPEGLVCPKLEFFLLKSRDNSLKISDTFFKEMKEVRVLSLFKIDLIIQKPSSLHLLSNLQTLCLHHCCISEDTAILREVKKLQILSIVDYGSLVLPKEMSQLTDLRMLTLSCPEIRDPENVISSLSQLQHLSIRNSVFGWQEGIVSGENNALRYELKHLPCLMALELVIPFSCLLLEDVSFENLTRYDISIGCKYDWDYYRTGTSSRLILDVHDVPHLVKCFSRLLKTVEVLHMRGLDDTKHFCNELDCNGFPKLKFLSISLCGVLQDIINTMELEWVDPPHSAFPRLEELKLSCLKQLEAVCHGPIPMGCFANLRDLIIEECNSLKYIIWLPTTQARESVLVFPQLGSLKLERLPNLINFYSTGTSGSQEPCSSFFNQVALPRLESLHLTLSLANVRTMWDNQDPVDYFQNLNSLRLHGFTSLKYLFPASVVKGLKQLEDLSIGSCGVEEIVANENGVEAVPMFEFPSLTSLKLWGLGQLKRFYREKYTLSCPFLKKLVVEDCEKVELLFQEKCLEGEHDEQPLFLIEKSTFPKVEELKLSFTRPMEIWRGQFSGESFGKLRVLDITGHCKISVAPPYSMLPVLQNLEELKVLSCNLVEEVIQEERLAGETIPRLTKIYLHGLPRLMNLSGLQAILQNLRSLKVSECGNLTNLVSPSMAKRLVQLKKLSLTACSMVKEIVGDDVSEATDVISFTNLEKLKLKDLVGLKSFSSGNNTLKFPSLEEVEIRQLPSLTHLYKIIPGLGQNLQNLRILVVSCCESLEILLTPSMAKTLEQLKDLTVRRCDKVKEIVENGGEAKDDEIVYTKLESLELLNLPILKSFCSARYTFIFPSLTSMIIDGCPQMEYFCMGHSMTPRLEVMCMERHWLYVENDLNTIIRNGFLERYDALQVLNDQHLKEEDCQEEVPDEDVEEGDSEEQHPKVEPSVVEDTEEENSEGEGTGSP